MKQIAFTTIDSTNVYAKLHRNEFARDEITCITADEQTAGRGKFNRPWLSPKGANIYATFFFTLPQSTIHLTSLAQVLSFSIAIVLQDLNPAIKWPNDIQLSGKKLGGVLCEVIFQPEITAVILGFGLNVNIDADYLKQIDQPATSLLIETGRQWNKQELLEKIQRQFEIDLHTFKQSGFTPFHSLIQSKLSNKLVRFQDGKNEIVGIYKSLNEDGSLNITLPDGTHQKIYTSIE
jgi:BirA family biotin operon repressor/biotin-[acetyl-CoA-carboxylase] ligase